MWKLENSKIWWIECAARICQHTNQIIFVLRSNVSNDSFIKPQYINNNETFTESIFGEINGRRSFGMPNTLLTASITCVNVLLQNEIRIFLLSTFNAVQWFCAREKFKFSLFVCFFFEYQKVKWRNVCAWHRHSLKLIIHIRTVCKA